MNSKKSWAMEFYQLLGYRIVEEEKDEKYLNNFMNRLLKKQDKKLIKKIEKGLLNTDWDKFFQEVDDKSCDTHVKYSEVFISEFERWLTDILDNKTKGVVGSPTSDGVRV